MKKKTVLLNSLRWIICCCLLSQFTKRKKIKNPLNLLMQVARPTETLTCTHVDKQCRKPQCFVSYVVKHAFKRSTASSHQHVLLSALIRISSVHC